MYDINESLLPMGMNRPGEPLTPVGVIIHETSTPNASDEAEVAYFSTHKCDASAHYFVDCDSITRAIPENEVAWHAGWTANHKFLSIELCHYEDDRFNEVWKRAVWLTADMCRRYGWDPDQCIHSHQWASATYKETDHTDPYAYFAKFGKTMDDFIKDVKGELNKMEPVISPEDANKIIAFLKASYGLVESVPGTEVARTEIGRLADVLRVASGQPKQNS